MAEVTMMSGAQPFKAVEKCTGCGYAKIKDGETFCSVYRDPGFKWAYGNCNLGTHVERKAEKVQKVNPLKASKKAAAGKH